MNALASTGLNAGDFAPGTAVHRTAVPGEPAVRVHKVRACLDVPEAETAWAELEAIAPASAYQSRAWLKAWIGTIGAARGVRPLIIVAEDCAGRPLCLLPLGLERRGPLVLAEFLGGKDANFTFGLFRPGFTPARAVMEDILKQAARQVPGGVDLFALVNQPRVWQDAANPMLCLAHQEAPSHGYWNPLQSDPETFIKNLISRDSRKKYRQKEKRLAEFGPVSHAVARGPAEARDILEAFHAQKAQRMRDKGIENVFDTPAARAFLEQCCVAPLARGEKPSIELHALKAGERIVAIFAGAPFGGRFSGMFNSFDLSGETARCSPGDLLLLHLLQAKCGEGFASFDLGVGEARYKQTFCRERQDLFDAYAAVTASGALLQRAKAGKRRLKGWVKHNPLAWSMIERLRRLRS